MKQQGLLIRFCLLMVVILISNETPWACLNGSSGVFGDAYARSVSQYPYPLGQHVDTQSEKVQQELAFWKQGLQEGIFKYSSDYGLYLVYDKKYVEAELLFRKLAAQWPNEYAAAANLGTVLEINGKNEEALQWIKRSMEINPTAHQGSEWIHVKILEAKIHPEIAIDAPTFLGVDFGSETIPTAKMDRRALKNLQKQLFYQLNERISFIPPHDPQIASLMFDLGNTTLAVGPLQKAFAIFKLAQDYGCVHPLLAARLKLAKSRR